MTRLVMAAALCSTGCAGTASLIRPALESPADAPKPATSPPAKRDADVVRARADAPAAAGARAPDVSSPLPGPASTEAPSPDPPDVMDEDGGLYRYDPMRGAVLSREPPPNRNITLRELLGLGRPDFADEEAEEKPDYPDLHDDPLAKSPVPPQERDRPLFPWLSNLIFEHDDELNDDAEDARGDVLRRRSIRDITNPGPDTANFPNSAFTVPKGRVYIETSPAAFFGKSRSFPAQYNWEFLIRYGLTDDLEFRLFSSGYSATMSTPYTTGFSPLVFDFKYHMWDENLEKHIPAAGVEMFIETPFGSPYFNGGTQPSLLLLLDHTLPFDILLEHNFGLTGIQDTFGSSVYEFSYQWALQRQVFADFAIFTHGFLNSSALPRLPILKRHVRKDLARGGGTSAMPDAFFKDPYATQPPISPMQVVVGGGFLWNLSKRLSVFGSYNAGLALDSPKIIALLGFAVAL